MNQEQIKHIVEGALLAAGRSLSLDNLQALFAEDGQPEKSSLKNAIEQLREDFNGRSIEIKETGSGYRIQVKQEFSQWISRLWEERPTRYSRALLETLALIAYRQPITRGEIEEVRGVSVSTSIIRTLQDRDWARVVGHRDVPGRPAMYGTTKNFLDYFGLKTLDELPTLAELRDIDSINVELDLDGEDDARGKRTQSGGERESGNEDWQENDDGPDDLDGSLGVEAYADLGDDSDAGMNEDDAGTAEENADVPAEEEARTEEAGDESEGAEFVNDRDDDGRLEEEQHEEGTGSRQADDSGEPETGEEDGAAKDQPEDSSQDGWQDGRQ